MIHKNDYVTYYIVVYESSKYYLVYENKMRPLRFARQKRRGRTIR